MLDFAYIIGGRDSEKKPTNAVQGYRMRRHKKTETRLEEVQVAPMLECRECPGVTQFESGIVVCGGWKDDALLTCEIYDSRAKSSVPICMLNSAAKYIYLFFYEKVEPTPQHA